MKYTLQRKREKERQGGIRRKRYNKYLTKLFRYSALVFHNFRSKIVY